MDVISESQKLKWILDYRREREGAQVFFGPHGYLSYRIVADVLSIEELYIEPSSRRQGNCENIFNVLIDTIVATENISLVQAGVQLDAPNAIAIQYALSKGNFSITQSVSDDYVIYSKTIKG